MRVERENTFLFMYVLGSGSSDTYNTCVLHSHMWLVRLVRLTVSDLLGWKYLPRQTRSKLIPILPQVMGSAAVDTGLDYTTS